MASQHPTRAAIAAAAAPAVAIAAFGNQWFTDHVRFEAKTELKRRTVNTVGGPFPWRFTPRSGGSGGTIWASQLVGIVAVVALTFLLAWLVARSASKFALLLGVCGGTMLATMAAYSLYILLSYGAFYGGHDIEPGINRFWYAVFHSPDASLWAAGVGLVAGCTAVLLAGGTTAGPAARPGAWPPGTTPPITGDAPPNTSSAPPPSPPPPAPGEGWGAPPPPNAPPAG